MSHGDTPCETQLPVLHQGEASQKMPTENPAPRPSPIAVDPATFPEPQSQRLHYHQLPGLPQLPASATVELWAAGRGSLPIWKQGWKLPRWIWASTCMRTSRMEVAPPQPHCYSLTSHDTRVSPVCHPWVQSGHFASGCRTSGCVPVHHIHMSGAWGQIPRHGHSSCPTLPGHMISPVSVAKRCRAAQGCCGSPAPAVSLP